MKTVALLLLPSLTTAFFPTPYRPGLTGRPGTSHQTLTISSLTTIASTISSLSAQSSPSGLSGPSNTTLHLPYPVVKAIREIARASAEVDLLETSSASWHFDGEKIQEGQLLVTALRGAVVDSLQREEGTVGRVLLGKALHAVQDFYAHTNWIELGKEDLAPLGRNVNLDTAGPTDSTCGACDAKQGGIPFQGDGSVCQDCVGVNSGATQLTSGFFVSSNAQPVTGGKCRHGGPLDDLTHGIGNRTTASVTLENDNSAPFPIANATQPQFSGTATASGIAVLSTSPANLSSVSHNSTTSTMSTNTQPSFIYGLNKDSSDCLWSPHSHLHKSAATFAEAASRQFMLDLLDGLSPQQVRILFGLPAEELYHNVSPINGTQNLAFPENPGFLNLPGSSLVSRVSSKQPYDPLDMLTFAPILLSASPLPLVNELVSFPVPVDSHMSYLSLGISCTACSVTFLPPDTTAPFGSDWHQAVDATGTHARMNITAPQTGIWTFTLTGAFETPGQGTFAVIAEGDSSLSMPEFSFVESAGRPSHEGYFDIGDAPPVDTFVGVVSEIVGPMNHSIVPLWVIRGADFAHIENSSVISESDLDRVPVLALQPGSGEEGFPDQSSFFGITKLPAVLQGDDEDETVDASKGFYVYVTGMDDQERQFQRVHPVRFIAGPKNKKVRVGSLDPIYGMVDGAIIRVARSAIPTATQFVDDENPLGIRVDNSSAGLSGFVTATSLTHPFITPLIATVPGSLRNLTNSTIHSTGYTVRSTDFSSHAIGLSTGHIPVPTAYHNSTYNATSPGASSHMSEVTVSVTDPTGLNRTHRATASLTLGPTWSSVVSGTEPTGRNGTGDGGRPTPFEPGPSFSTGPTNWTSPSGVNWTSFHQGTGTVTVTKECSAEVTSINPPEQPAPYPMITETSTPFDFTARTGGYSSPSPISPAPESLSFTIITSDITAVSTIISPTIITSTIAPYAPVPPPPAPEYTTTSTTSSVGYSWFTTSGANPIDTITGPVPSVITGGVGRVEVGGLGVGVVGVAVGVAMWR